MNLLVYFVVPILGSYFLIFCLLWGMHQIAGKGGKSKQRRWVLSFLFTTVIVLLSLLVNPAINLLVTITIPFFAKYLNESGKGSLIYNVVLIVAIYLLDIMVSLGGTFLIGSGMLYLNSPELYLLSLNLVLRLVQFLAIRLIVLLVRKRKGGDVTGKQLAEAFILPVFSIFNVLTLLVFMQIYSTMEMMFLFIVNLVLLIAMNIWFAILIDTMSENNRLEKEVSLLKQQASYEMEYYKREEEKYEESRKLIHDIRNHILALEQLCGAEKNEQAISYGNHLQEMLNGFGQTYYTSDCLLNIILNDKVSKMRQLGIREDIKVGELDLSFMQDTDITTVFANILDNAIEAGKETEKGYIKLRIRQINSFLSIALENSAVRKPISIKDGFKSTKANHEGLGIKNVKRVVGNYNGDIQCRWENGIFYTDILLAVTEEDRVW